MRKITTRVQLEISPARILELEELQKQTGLRTKSDLLEDALTLFEYVVQHRAKGMILYFGDEEGNRSPKSFLMPSIERVAPKK